MTARTCTVRYASGVCGKPGVHSFRSSITDEIFTECAEHYTGPSAPVRIGHRVGDKVEVRRHGKTYIGTVTEVGARGAVYAQVTYGNGATRFVRV